MKPSKGGFRMEADRCTFWYIHSFILDKLDFQKLVKLLATTKSPADLTAFPTEEAGYQRSIQEDNQGEQEEIPLILNEVGIKGNGFAPYVSFQFDEIICKDNSEPDEGWPVIVADGDEGPSVRGALRRRYYFELTGLCSHIIELAIRPDECSKLDLLI
ncbi:MAG: hypothetical protein ACRD47_06285 [Nitrososphaeraceae archaeon]